MKKQSVVLAIVAIVAIIFAAVFGIQKGDLNKQITELNTKVTSLTSDLEAAKKEAADAAGATAKAVEEAVAEATKNAEEATAKAVEEALAKAAEEAEAAKKAAEEEAAKLAEEAAKAAEEAAKAAEEEAAKVEEAVEETVEEAAEEAKETVEEVKEAVEEAVKPESAKTKVSIWHTFTNDQEAYLNKMATEFNASQDQYEVQVQSQPYSGFTSAVYNAVVNHSGPDIIFNYASEAAAYVKDGLVANLDEYIFNDEIGFDIESLLPEYLLEEINAFEDGHIHYLPGATTGPIVFYNKTLLNELGLEVPKTWTELVEVSKKIKEAKPEVTPFGIDSKIDVTQVVILETGNGYIDVENKKVLFDQDAEAISWLGQQIKDGLFSIAPSGNYFSEDFNAGIVAMYQGSCAGIPYINPNGFEFDVAPAITSGDEKAAYTIWNRGPIVFSANGEEAAKGAYQFVKFMLTIPENAEGWAEAMVALTPWANAQQVEGYDAFLAKQPALAAVQANFEHGVTFPAVTGASEVRNAIGEMITVIAGGTDVAEALNAAVETSNNALQGK